MRVGSEQEGEADSMQSTETDMGGAQSQDPDNA